LEKLKNGQSFRSVGLFVPGGSKQHDAERVDEGTGGGPGKVPSQPAPGKTIFAFRWVEGRGKKCISFQGVVKRGGPPFEWVGGGGRKKRTVDQHRGPKNWSGERGKKVP